MRVWFRIQESFFTFPLVVIASFYSFLAANGIPYDGYSQYPAWSNAVAYWAALFLLLVYFEVLLKFTELDESTV